MTNYVPYRKSFSGNVRMSMSISNTHRRKNLNELKKSVVCICCSLTTVSAGPTFDDSAHCHRSDLDHRSSELHNKRSVTVPSSLADSAISLSTGESCVAAESSATHESSATCESSVTLSSSSKMRCSNESQQVLHDTPSPSRVLSPPQDASTSSSAKDKRKKIGLSKIVRGRRKDL